MTAYIHLHQKPKAASFTQLPNFLFETPTYRPLSNEAKVLYAMILRRTDLSRKNAWADEYGRIYLYYPINEVVGLLRCGRQKAGLWKTQPYPPKILRSGFKHRLQGFPFWNAGGLKTVLGKYDNQSS